MRLWFLALHTVRAVFVGLLAGFIVFGAQPAARAQPATTDAWLRAAMPDADAFAGPDGTPPAYVAYRNGDVIGYAFFSRDVSAATGYSARPLNVAIGLRRDGVIAGARLVEHQEPILAIGVSDQQLARFVEQYAGVDIRTRVRLRPFAAAGDRAVDGIRGATISSLSLNDTIVGSARAVARARGLLQPTAGVGGLDLDTFRPERWNELLAAGSIVRLTLTNEDVDRALAESGGPVPLIAPGADPNAAFITLFAALATPAQIGRNLLGEAPYARLMGDLKPGAQLVFVAAQGLYSFKGTGYLRSGSFDRIQIVQGARTIALLRDQHQRLDRLAAGGAPELREAALFQLPPESGLDPMAPWRLELAVTRARADGSVATHTFALNYDLPSRHRLTVPPQPPDAAATGQPLWLEVWQARIGRVAVLVAALLTLYGILVFQPAVTQRKGLWLGIRLAALAFSLVWLGWYAGAQLSVVNVLTFANALRTSFEWEFFLVDPLIFILWGWVAVALLFWGRGVFCGWLCPFGALQELLSRLARVLRVPQFSLPFGIHERLWPTKYIIFLLLFAASLSSMSDALLGAEVEPFKTAIALKFIRAWPWVLYTLGLLAVGLFVERFFCRYVCPLGGALAIPARIRMFEWLKRRRQCGTECNICAVNCPVQAIHPDGRINPNECIHCLKCQTLYYDSTVCPPRVARAKRAAERQALRAKAAP